MRMNSINKKNILVIGDFMLDQYYFGKVSRISPEAPVPVFNKVDNKYVLGGAANVVANLIAAEQYVEAITVIGNDTNGKRLVELLRELGCGISGVVLDDSRKTIVKTRLLAQNNQQLLRIDEENIARISKANEQHIIENIREKISGIDVVIMSDYMKGVMTQDLCKEVIKIAKDKNVPVLFDVKEQNVHKYEGATLIKPNKNELQLLTGMTVRTEEDILAATYKLRNLTNAKYILTTLGSKGMLIVGEKIEKWIPSDAHEVFDVSGAGDTVISYVAAALANEIPIEESAVIANYAAGIKVTKIGTSPVCLNELYEVLQIRESKLIKTQKRKIVSKEELLANIQQRKGKRVVFTNGCFDILHRGHISYLKQAATLGDILVIGLNSDDSVKRLKGTERPINMQNDRAEILSALEFVDFVVIFKEDTPLELIKSIKPDVLVKGADYNIKNVVGAEYVLQSGGSVELISFVDNYSTTNIINKMKG